MFKWTKKLFDKIDKAKRIKYLKKYPYGVYEDHHGRRWFNPEYRTGTSPGTLRKIM